MELLRDHSKEDEYALHTFYRKLLGLKDVAIKNVEDNEGNTEIYPEKHVKPHTCPVCGEKTYKIHDYRNQRKKNIPAFGKRTMPYTA